MALALGLAAGPAAAACGAAAGTVQAASVDERRRDRARRRADAQARRPRPSPSVARRSGAGGGGARVAGEAFRRPRGGACRSSPPPPTAGIARSATSARRFRRPARASAAEALLAAGLARVRPEFETRGCEAGRLALESAARAKGLGVWRDPDYVVLAADDVASLARRDGRFVIVEGVVRRIGVGRARLYLDLGGRGALTVVASREDRRPRSRRRRSVDRPGGRENSGARRIGRPIRPADWKSSIRSCWSGSGGPRRTKGIGPGG